MDEALVLTLAERGWRGQVGGLSGPLSLLRGIFELSHDTKLQEAGNRRNTIKRPAGLSQQYVGAAHLQIHSPGGGGGPLPGDPWGPGVEVQAGRGQPGAGTEARVPSRRTEYSGAAAQH